jgi:hypothetical protein
MVRTTRAGMDLDRDDLCSPPRQDLYFRYEARDDVVADEVGQPFLGIERFRDAP